jgi:hypothetical protein
MKYVVERWTGKAWGASMCSPYKTMSEVTKHLREYYWHYTIENPYRIKEYKEKKKVKYNQPKFNFQDWNSDIGMAVKI